MLILLTSLPALPTWRWLQLADMPKLVLVEEHQEVLPYWHSLKTSGPLTLLHIDAHPDGGVSTQHDDLWHVRERLNSTADLDAAVVRSIMTDNDVHLIGGSLLGLLQTIF